MVEKKRVVVDFFPNIAKEMTWDTCVAQFGENAGVLSRRATVYVGDWGISLVC